MKRLILFLILFIYTVTSFAQNYKIFGKVEGLADGTWLYVRLASLDKQLDSAQVQNGQFILKGKMDEAISRVYLHTAKYTNYTSFWLEQTPLTINLKVGEFKKAIITGSKTQLENEKQASVKKSITKAQDSLDKLIETEKDEDAKKTLVAKYRMLRAKEQELDIDYVKNNPKSLLSVELLDIYSSTWGKEKITPLYAGLSKQMQDTRYGKNVKTFIALNRNINVGDHFTDFEQTNASGKKIKLSDIKGKYVLLDFWASWCGPCREESPTLVATYNLFKDKGLAIIGVSADDNKTNWLSAIKEDKLPWENVSDLKGDKNVVAIMYGISAYPTSYLMDETGKIIAKNLRGEELKKKLTELMP